MSFRRSLLEGVSYLAASCLSIKKAQYPENPKIFILRNNDLGDVLVLTPLLEALKKRFPKGELIVGVGPWARAILEGNPHVDQILPISAPWHNKQVCMAASHSLGALKAALQYLFFSPEMKALKALHCDIGIDVLGSPQGSWLMMKAGIPYRLGVHGYAGGHSACEASLIYREDLHVASFILGFAELLGEKILPEACPQLFLSEKELSDAEAYWPNPKGKKKRLLVGPGAGLENKRWPIESYAALVREIAQGGLWDVVICGAAADQALAEEIQKIYPEASDLCGRLSLRECFGLTALADLILCNSSMLLHSAAAFKRPTLLLLGPAFNSQAKHAKLWAYPPPCYILGKQTGTSFLPGPQEAYDYLKKCHLL